MVSHPFVPVHDSGRGFGCAFGFESGGMENALRLGYQEGYRQGCRRLRSTSSSYSYSSFQLRGKGVANVIVSHRQQLPTSHLRRTLPSRRCLEIPQGLRCSRKWIWLVFGKLNNSVLNERKPTQSGPRSRLYRR
jgi:hypothetical protein